MDIKIAITNLGAYNEGRLLFEWIDLPATGDELQAALDVIEIDGERYEEYFISDYEAPFSIGEFDNIDRLNEYAEQLDALDEGDRGALKAYLDEVSNDFEEALEMATNGDYIEIHDCYSMTDVAHYYMDELFAHEMPEFALRYFDYEAFGRDLSFDNTYAFRDGVCYEFPA